MGDDSANNDNGKNGHSFEHPVTDLPVHLSNGDALADANSGQHLTANGHNGHNGNGANGHASSNGHHGLKLFSPDTIRVPDTIQLPTAIESQESIDATDDAPEPAASTPPAPLAVPKNLHRLAAARRSKGITCEELARRLSMSPQEVQSHENSELDLQVSLLMRWSQALGVPVSELIIEPDANILSTKLSQQQAERLMRIARRLRSQTRRRSTERLAETFIDQLIEIMPGLEALNAKPRDPNKNKDGATKKKNSENGRMPKPLSEDVFTAPEH